VTPDAPKCNSTFPSASLPLRSKSVLFGELIGHDGKNEMLFVNWKGRAFSANKLREKRLLNDFSRCPKVRIRVAVRRCRQ
jgi:hypothetical protein